MVHLIRDQHPIPQNGNPFRKFLSNGNAYLAETQLAIFLSFYENFLRLDESSEKVARIVECLWLAGHSREVFFPSFAIEKFVDCFSCNKLLAHLHGELAPPNSSEKIL